MKFIIYYFAIALIFATNLSAQTVTAFKSGEQSTGETKQCFYSFESNTYTRTVASYQLCPMSIQVNPGNGYGTRPSNPLTITAFKSGEEVTGNTKQCYYSFLGNTYTKTINSLAFCPMSIQIQQ